MDRLFKALEGTGQRFLLQTYSALDRYYRKQDGRHFFFLTDAPLALLASLFEDVRYRGTSESDADAVWDGVAIFFRCVESLERAPRRDFTLQHLYYDISDGCYLDPAGMYPDLRARLLRPCRAAESSPLLIKDAALLISRYDLDCPAGLDAPLVGKSLLSSDEQRLLLSLLLTSDRPERGLSLLRDTLFIRAHWPELASMAAVPQTKDYHPEGDVLTHVLEAFKYRKKNDLALGLAILLHDLGKTVAEGTKDKPYENHAGRGAGLARRFLERLSFPPALITEVEFLIRHHMMPEALPRMPLYRVEKLLASPFFPALLELYRADLLSTYRGPEKYYEACRVYRSYRRKVENPYKTPAAGKPVIAS